MNVATVPVLQHALRHPDPIYRFAGALALGNRKLVRMNRDLIRLLEDENVYVQQMARLSLVKLSKGQDFGPLPGCSCGDEAEAVQLWDEWWRKNSQ
jgi:HEAT repeat protein